jgi:hypothetical protein
MVMILGPTVIRTAVREALGLPVLAFALTGLVVVLTRNIGWLSVGGAVISGLGARLWANRLFRLSPSLADAPLPPTTLPLEPGARGWL